jgi:putative ABC transport system ATP-binding protein
MRLFPELTAWENIEVKRRLTNTVTTEQATEWLDRLGLHDKKNSLANTMSYGEQQRVSIVRALLQPFDWLLMDEPFSHLDHANTDKAIALISEVVQQHKAGMILADLDENNFFPYTQTIIL